MPQSSASGSRTPHHRIRPAIRLKLVANRSRNSESPFANPAPSNAFFAASLCISEIIFCALEVCQPTRPTGIHANACCGLRQASPTTCRASVARYGQPREKRSVCGEPAGYELSEEPHALRLARLPLCEKPERSVHVQVGARHPYQ